MKPSMGVRKWDVKLLMKQPELQEGPEGSGREAGRDQLLKLRNSHKCDAWYLGFDDVTTNFVFVQMNFSIVQRHKY